MRQRRLNFFYAALVLALLAGFGYVYGINDAGTTLVFLGAAVFWIAVAFGTKEHARAKKDRQYRQEYYQARFGRLAPLGPWIPFLLLGAVLLVWRFLPDPRPAQVLLGVSALYAFIHIRRMSGYVSERRREDRRNALLGTRSPRIGRRDGDEP